MLITFSSDAYENITFFEKIARQLLHLMGHSGTVPGALRPEETAPALAKLEASIQHQKNPPVATSDDDDEPSISLAHRAVPLIAMLKAAEKNKCSVIWK